MIVTNKIQLHVGDVFTKNDLQFSRYSVNRIEKTITEDGIEQINSVRLRQISPVEIETERKNSWDLGTNAKTIFIDCSVDDLFRDYSLIRRIDRRGDYVDVIKRTKSENRDMLHSIDIALKQLKELKNGDTTSEESLHLDSKYLSETLGKVIIFEQHRWLANIVYTIDRLGKNYNASISSPSFEVQEGYGFVSVSSKNTVKRFVVNSLANILKKLNSNNVQLRGSFENYEDDTYSMKELIENVHRSNDPWFDEQSTRRADVIPMSKVLIDVDKLPSKEEVAEQTKLMNEYQDSIVKQAEEKKLGKQTGPTLEPIITPQIGE